MEKLRDQRKERGITLVALVVTIVVLLILAGITIVYVMGDNGVFSKAQRAGLETELAKIEEQAAMIYQDKFIAKQTGEIKEITNKEIADELIANGNPIEIRGATAEDITGISLKPATVSMDKNKTANIKVSINGSSDGYTYYAVIDGKYYKANFNNLILNIERQATTPTGTTVTPLNIEVETGYSTTLITNIAIDQAKKTVQITSGASYGNTTITVKYGSKTADCPVKVEETQSNWEAIAEAAKQIANDTAVTSSTTEVTKNGVLLKVGETYKVRCDGSLREVRLIGFKQDELVNQGIYGGTHTYASMTFEFMDCLGTHAMNGTSSSNSTNAGGWAATEMRKWLNGYTTTADEQSGAIGGIAKAIATNMGDSEGNKYIKQVKKQYIKERGNKNSNGQKTQDYLWLLACSEIFTTGAQTGAITTEGGQYRYYADLNPAWNQSNPKLVKKVSGSALRWWVRSASYANDINFCRVGSIGDGSSADSYRAYGVAPGFCI